MGSNPIQSAFIRNYYFKGVIKSSNQADARRRAQRQYDNAKKSGASKKTQDTLRAELDAAKARESGAKRSSGGAISRAFGW